MLLRTCWGNGELAALEVGVVERINSFVCISIVCHFDEAETFRPTGHLIHDNRMQTQQGLLSQSEP